LPTELKKQKYFKSDYLGGVKKEKNENPVFYGHRIEPSEAL
jgi:hypothetical protein